MIAFTHYFRLKATGLLDYLHREQSSKLKELLKLPILIIFRDMQNIGSKTQHHAKIHLMLKTWTSDWLCQKHHECRLNMNAGSEKPEHSDQNLGPIASKTRIRV